MDLRAFNPATDKEGHRTLFQLSFPETEGTAAAGDAHYAWKFRGFPDDIPAYEYVAMLDGRLVGYYAAIPFPYVVNGETRRIAMVCDVMTHPDERGKGIFTKLGRYATAQLAEAGLYCATGYPIRPEVIPGHLKVGWKIVQTLPVYARPVRSTGLLPSLLAWLSPAVDPALALVATVLGAGREPKGLRCEAIDRDTLLSDAYWPRVTSCIDATDAPKPVHLVKHREFVRWRTGAPGTSYSFIVATHPDDDRIAGIVIARSVVLKGIPTLAVLDFMARPDIPGAANALHGALARHARAERLSLVAAMSSVEAARAGYFRRNGYLKTPAAFSFIVKALSNDALASRVEEAPWTTWWLDSDDL